jgi:hypothetical protein
MTSTLPRFKLPLVGWSKYRPEENWILDFEGFSRGERTGFR